MLTLENLSINVERDGNIWVEAQWNLHFKVISAVSKDYMSKVSAVCTGLTKH